MLPINRRIVKTSIITTQRLKTWWVACLLSCKNRWESQNFVSGIDVLTLTKLERRTLLPSCNRVSRDTFCTVPPKLVKCFSRSCFDFLLSVFLRKLRFIRIFVTWNIFCNNGLIPSIDLSFPTLLNPKNRIELHHSVIEKTWKSSVYWNVELLCHCARRF